jgi:predicted ATPase
MHENVTRHSRPGRVVGRAAEVGYLEQCLEAALRGERQVVFVSGEPGIGKTTVVDTFLERVNTRAQLRIGHGQCIEQYGPGEAYLPLLEIGTRLCQEPGGERLIALLRQYAPTWLVQLPAVIPDTEREQLHRRVQGATRERMRRRSSRVTRVTSWS